MHRHILYFLILFTFSVVKPQPLLRDSLSIQFNIIYQEYNALYNIIKIKLPPYLSTAEVMAQIRLLLFWPGTSPPNKETRVYVFRDLDPIGTVSRTGCVYIPGRGIFWDLREWHPDSSLLQEPTEWEIHVYNVYLDSLFSNGFHFNESQNNDVKLRICQQFQLTPAQLDTLYYRVKYWWERTKANHPSQVTGQVH